MNKIKTYKEFNEEVDWRKLGSTVGTAAVLGGVGAGAYVSIANHNLATNAGHKIVSGQEFNRYTLLSNENFDLNICEDDGFIVAEHSYEEDSTTFYVKTLNVPKGHNDVYFQAPFLGAIKASSKKFSGSSHVKISNLEVKESTKDYIIYYGDSYTPFDYMVVDNQSYSGKNDGVEFEFEDSSIGSWKYYEIDDEIYLFRPYKMGGGTFGGGGSGQNY